MFGKWYEKPLSSNDIGKTGSHQSAVVIPKSDYFNSDFFPHLDATEPNPHARITFLRRDYGSSISARIVYYNNKMRGGSRDEIRITGLGEYLRQMAPNVGDFLRVELESDGNYFVVIRRNI